MLEQVTGNLKILHVLLVKHTPWNSSSMICNFEKLKLNKNWNTQNIRAKTQQTHF